MNSLLSARVHADQTEEYKRRHRGLRDVGALRATLHNYSLFLPDTACSSVPGDSDYQKARMAWRPTSTPLAERNEVLLRRLEGRPERASSARRSLPPGLTRMSNYLAFDLGAESAGPCLPSRRRKAKPRRVASLPNTPVQFTTGCIGTPCASGTRSSTHRHCATANPTGRNRRRHLGVDLLCSARRPPDR